MGGLTVHCLVSRGDIQKSKLCVPACMCVRVGGRESDMRDVYCKKAVRDCQLVCVVQAGRVCLHLKDPSMLHPPLE